MKLIAEVQAGQRARLHPFPNRRLQRRQAKSITNVVLTLVDPGEEVILPAPYWVSYADMVAFAGGTSKVLPTSIENDFKFSPTTWKRPSTTKLSC